MLKVYDVQLELRGEANFADVLRLKDHFKALKISAIGLERDDIEARSEELSFSIYGDFGPFMMKKLIQECAENIFPGSVVELSQNG